MFCYFPCFCFQNLVRTYQACHMACPPEGAGGPAPLPTGLAPLPPSHLLLKVLQALLFLLLSSRLLEALPLLYLQLSHL